jgi:sister-chromatid-cohesion protein PDS5
LSTYLSELEQDNIDTRDLDTVAAALVQEVILHHKDKEVKIFAACCLADIIRIYAPDPPYNDVQLKDVFKLFIEQLSYLDTENSAFDRYVYLLERLVLVKAFVLLVELDQDLVNDLFSTLFKVVR